MNVSSGRALRTLVSAALASLALATSSVALADDDLEGRITHIDYGKRTFVVEGVAFHADERTDYDDDLRGFQDLRVGQRVEVDFKLRNGRRMAKEIELDD